MYSQSCRKQVSCHAIRPAAARGNTPNMNTPNKLPDLKHSASVGVLYIAVALTTIVVPVLGVGYAAWLFAQEGISAIDLSLLLGMYLFTILGVELGYHRYLTHRALKVRPWLKRLLVVAGAMAADGPPIWWSAIHRRHHAFSDQPGDPHSPNAPHEGLAGWWHAHIGWMFKPDYTAAHSVLHAKDLLREADLRAIDQQYIWWVLLGLAFPALVGGALTASWHGAWTGFVWGGLVRMFCGQHALWWGIVTLCHTIGTRPFETEDRSRNNVLVAILFLGDGWHNNHHAFPASAKVGLRWWEFDPTWWVIVVLRRLGLVWDVNVPADTSARGQHYQRGKPTT